MYRDHFNKSLRLQAVSWNKGTKRSFWRKKSEIHLRPCSHKILFQALSNGYLSSQNQHPLSSFSKPTFFKDNGVYTQGRCPNLKKQWRCAPETEQMSSLKLWFLCTVPVHHSCDAMWDLRVLLFFSCCRAASSPLPILLPPRSPDLYLANCISQNYYWKCAKRMLTTLRHWVMFWFGLNK